jgi:hypothetical protein
MLPENSLSYSQKLAFHPCPDPDKSSSQPVHISLRRSLILYSIAA